MGIKIMDCVAISALLLLGNVTATPGGGLPNDLVQVTPLVHNAGSQPVVYFIPVSTQQVQQNQFAQRSNNYQVSQPQQQQYYAQHPQQQVTSRPVITPAPVQVTAGYRPAPPSGYNKYPATTAYKPAAPSGYSPPATAYKPVSNGYGHGGSATYGQQQSTVYKPASTSGYGHGSNAGYGQGANNAYKPAGNTGYNNYGNNAAYKSAAPVASMAYAPRYQFQKSLRLPFFSTNFGFSAGRTGGNGNAVGRSSGGNYGSGYGNDRPRSRLYFSKQIGTRKTTFEYPPGQIRREMVHPGQRGYALEFSASSGK